MLNQFIGRCIENVQYKHIWLNKFNQVILADYITDNDGTGLVHIASGFGLDDYYVAKKYGIKIYCPVDDSGKFSKEINDPELEGVFYERANEIILDRIKKLNALLRCDKIVHSIPID
ncbi:MAG: class I tRNA ligase family protein [Clostridia bacterium]|nr:class I tRNA ligase family protein [Clostridia bacterium]